MLWYCPHYNQKFIYRCIHWLTDWYIAIRDFVVVWQKTWKFSSCWFLIRFLMSATGSFPAYDPHFDITVCVRFWKRWLMASWQCYLTVQIELRLCGSLHWAMAYWSLIPAPEPLHFACAFISIYLKILKVGDVLTLRWMTLRWIMMAESNVIRGGI